MAQSLANSVFEEDKQFIAPLYGKANIEFVRGEGSYLFDKTARSILTLSLASP
jgi:acetylornithine/N-succinyldiaminopimelate aminotransferase